MKSIGQKRDPARLFLRRIGLVALCIIVFIAASGVYKVYQKEKESRESRVQAENEYAELQKRETRLKEDLAMLQTDRGMEEALRQQYELAESGENLIVIVEPPTIPSTEATSSPLQKWFEGFLFWR
ncbi:hypothetical protein C4585_00955 [Candidatus Parcubacteria bacterium]|nr:MAG: hypothetical protein C4585_00955 [Candidatus Parcubacteria bacterium]